MSRVVEEVALDYAKRRAARLREEPFELFGKEVRLLGDGESEAYAAHHIAHALANGMIAPDSALQSAREGDRLFCNALMILGAAQLRGDLELQGSLRSAVIGTLAEPPKVKSGWKRETNFFRDVAIAILVKEVCTGFDMKPTGRSPKRQSACAIVAQVIHGMNYDSVRKVWNRLGKQI